MKLLVYIPCHTDFAEAVLQATKIRKDFDSYQLKSYPKTVLIEIIISVNSYLPSHDEKISAEQVCDEVIYNGIGYLGDVNIANGFLLALKKKPDLLWIFSANDFLNEGAIARVLDEFFLDESIDLLVTNALDLDLTYQEVEIVNPPKAGFCYGLITGVIYRLKNIHPYFHNGPFMAWTGWSHLAVIQSAMHSLGGLKVKTVPWENIYVEGERDIDNISNYGHSIYGMLILGYSFSNSKKDSKKFIRRTVLNRFYSWHMYSRNWKYAGQLVSKKNYLGWNQGIAEALIWKSSKLVFGFYLCMKRLPFRKIRKFQKYTITKIFKKN